MKIYRVSYEDWEALIWHNSAWEAAILALFENRMLPRVKVQRMVMPSQGFAGWIYMSGQKPLHYKRRSEGGVMLLNDSGAYEAGAVFEKEGIHLYSQVEVGTWVG